MRSIWHCPPCVSKANPGTCIRHIGMLSVPLCQLWSAVMSDADEETLSVFPPERSDRLVREELNATLHQLGMSPHDLSRRMAKLGDPRSFTAISRSINRMVAGEVKVAGEVVALLEFMKREHRRAQRKADSLVWKRLADGSFTAEVDDFTITLVPKSRGRWHISIVHQSGYSAPWPSWEGSLSDAKVTAVICLEDAVTFLEDLSTEQVGA